MAIDGIGKSGKIAEVATQATNAVAPNSVQATFDAGRKTAVEGTNPTSPLEQLRSGKIDLNRYLDLKVEQATSGLENKLDPERLDFIRNTLRNQLASDPILSDLVNAVSSSAKTTSDER